MFYCICIISPLDLNVKSDFLFFAKLFFGVEILLGIVCKERFDVDLSCRKIGNDDRFSHCVTLNWLLRSRVDRLARFLLQLLLAVVDVDKKYDCSYQSDNEDDKEYCKKDLCTRAA